MIKTLKKGFNNNHEEKPPNNILIRNFLQRQIKIYFNQFELVHLFILLIYH